MEKNNEVLLKVDHLCQYFRLGHKDMKAVDDVSFEIHKGESFGLVGESGCGKTTTGRSIIKLYDITSGNIYFKGQRIGAGTRSYKNAISAARADAAKRIKQLRSEKKAGYQEEIKKVPAERNFSKVTDAAKKAIQIYEKKTKTKYQKSSREDSYQKSIESFFPQRSGQQK